MAIIDITRQPAIKSEIFKTAGLLITALTGSISHELTGLWDHAFVMLPFFTAGVLCVNHGYTVLYGE